MPWVAPDGTEYKLCLLDTNIISEICKNRNGERDRFLKKFLDEFWMICITSGSLFEIRKNKEVYEKFLEIFSIFPFLVLKPFINLFEDEKIAYDANEKATPIQLPISFANKDPRLQLKGFMDELFSREEVIQTENSRKQDEIQVLSNWISRKENFKSELDAANSKDAKRYVEEAAIQTIIKLDLDLGSNFIRKKVENKEHIDTGKFPSVLIMLYSQYYRLYDPGWKPAPQEVTDIEIMAAIPYVDVVITENFQAEILKKVRSNFELIKDLEIYTLRDVRGWDLK